MARESIMVLNPDDHQVDDGEVNDLVDRWNDADVNPVSPILLSLLTDPS